MILTTLKGTLSDIKNINKLTDVRMKTHSFLSLCWLLGQENVVRSKKQLDLTQQTTKTIDLSYFFLDLPLDIYILNHSYFKNGTLQISWKAVENGECEIKYFVEIIYLTSKALIGPTGNTSTLIDGVGSPVAAFVYAEYHSLDGEVKRGEKSQVFLYTPKTTSRTLSYAPNTTPKTTAAISTNPIEEKGNDIFSLHRKRP